MATAPATVVRNSSKRFHQFEILGPAISKQAGTSTKNAKSNVNKSPKKQSIQTIYNFVNKATGANQGSRTPMPSHLEEAYRRYEAFASGRKYSEINDYYNKTGKSAYTIENGRIVRDPNFTRDVNYNQYNRAPYRPFEKPKYNEDNWWGYGSFEKWVKSKNAPKFSDVNYWDEGTPESEKWHKYHNYQDPNWQRDEDYYQSLKGEEKEKWAQHNESHFKLYENEQAFLKAKVNERRKAEQRYFGRRDWINSRTPEEQQQYHDENYATHHNKRGVLDRMFAPLMNNTAAQVTYAKLAGGDKSEAFVNSLKYMLPWTDDVSDRKYWSDVIQYVNENLPENATSTESATPLAIGGFKHKTKDEIVNDKFSTAVMGLGLDVAADPLTYLTGGFSAGAKILKGTGAVKNELRAAEQMAQVGSDFKSSDAFNFVQKARQAKHDKALRNIDDEVIGNHFKNNGLVRYTDDDVAEYIKFHQSRNGGKLTKAESVQLDEMAKRLANSNHSSGLTEKSARRILLKNNPELFEELSRVKAERVDSVANQIAEANRRAKEYNLDYLNDSLSFEEAREIVLDTRPELIDNPNRLNEMTYEFMQTYGRDIKGFRGISEGQGIKFFGKELASAEKLRTLGNKTVAPLFNVANRKLRSTLGTAFSGKNKLLRYANKKGDEEVFSAVFANLLSDKVGLADKTVAAGKIADRLDEFFKNATDEQLMDFVIQHDKGTFRNLLKYEDSFDEIREKAISKLSEKNPEYAARLKANKDYSETLNNLTDNLYKSVTQELGLKKYKNFSGVLERREKQLKAMMEARDAGIHVENLEDFTNQYKYLKENEEIISRYFKEIYEIYGKPISSLSDDETYAALGLMKDLDDIASLTGGEIPWSELSSFYGLSVPSDKSFVKEMRSKINERYGDNTASNFLPSDLNPDKFAESVRQFRDELIDVRLQELADSGYYDDLANVSFNDSYLLSPEQHSIWKMLHYDELTAPVHYDINNVSKLLNQKSYRSAYKNLEKDAADIDKVYGQQVLDEMHSIMEERYGLTGTQIDEMFELANNNEYRQIHELFAKQMWSVAKEEVRAGRLGKDTFDKMFNKYIPREISENAKQYWEKIFGEPFENYIKQPGKFNPVHGEQMTYTQQRTFKAMEDGEKWWQQQIEKKYVSEIFKNNRITKFTDEDVERFIKTHDMSKYPELAEMKKAASKLYNYNVAEIFMNRVIGHNKLMQSDAVNNLVKARLTTPFTGVKSSDKIVIPYIDMMEDCRKIAGLGDFAEFSNGQQVFDQIVSSVGLDPRLVGKNISHFEVTSKQLKDIQNQIKSGLVFTAKKNKIPDMATHGYNMDKTVYNMLNRYTKAQMSIMQNGLLNLYDTFLTKIKVLNTIINPGFHGQNAPSNMFQSFLGIGEDAFNVSQIKKAIDIIRTGDPRQTITLNGQTYTYRQMRRIFESYGVIDNTFYNDFKFTKEADNLSDSQLRDVSMEDFNNFFKNDFIGKLSFLNPIANIANKPFKYMGLVGSSIEGAQRANLFMACVNKGYDFRESVDMVNKFLFDYGDLTSQEQQIFKRIIPFYSFLRKNVPMELEMMLEQPHKFVNTQRIFDTISRMSDDYIPPDERNEYRDTDIQLPFRVGGEYYGVSNNMPYTQFEKWTDINKAIGQTSPLLKAIPELLMGEYAYTGMDIDSVPSYIFNQAPIGKIPDRLVHDKNFGTNPRDAKPDYEPDTTRRNMWLLGQGIGFPINQINRQEYKKDGVDIFEEYENDPGMLFDLINAIRARELPENSILNR